jgi:serine/threonine-protein kinase RsbW
MSTSVSVETAESAENIVELAIGSSYRFIELVGSVTDNITQIAGFSSEDGHWIGLAVRESVVNAIKHGNQLDSNKQVDVRFLLSGDTLAIFIRDRGRGFDVTQIADPLNPENLLNPNGRGIFYMRTFMDEVDFVHHPQGGMVVRMLKRKPLGVPHAHATAES